MSLPAPTWRWRAGSVTGLADGASLGTATVPGTGTVTTALSQATAAKRPLWRNGANGINGQPAFQFDGVDDALVSAATITRPAAGTWMVIGTVAPATVGGIFGQGFHMPSMEMYGDSQTLGLYTSAGISFGGTATPAGGNHVLTGVFNGAASNIRLDGTVMASGSLPAAAAGAATITVGSHVTEPRSWNGKYAEIIGWNRVLTAAELADAHSYVQDTYGIPVADYVPTTTSGLAVSNTGPGLKSTTAAVTSLTTDLFTPPAGSVLVAKVSYQNSASGTGLNQTLSSSAGLTWRLRVRKSIDASSLGGGTAGDTGVEIWYASVPTQTAMTVTASSASASARALRVMVVPGAEATPGGAVAAAYVNSGTFSASLVTTRPGSLVFAAGADWQEVGGATPNATYGSGQQSIDTVNLAGQYTIRNWRTTTPVAASGSTVTMTQGTTGQQATLAIVEIREASTGSPQPVTASAALTSAGSAALGVTASVNDTYLDSYASATTAAVTASAVHATAGGASVTRVGGSPVSVTASAAGVGVGSAAVTTAPGPRNLTGSAAFGGSGSANLTVIAAPGPPPGAPGTPPMSLQLVAYDFGGAKRGAVPKGLGITRYVRLGETPTLQASFTGLEGRVKHLAGPVEVALQYSTTAGNWVEPINGRFVVDDDGWNRTDAGLVHEYQFLGLVGELVHADVGALLLNAEGQRQFAAATPAAIMLALINENKADGRLAWLQVGFTATATSDGQTWAKVATRAYGPQDNLLSVLEGLQQAGFCDYWMDGRTLHMSNPDTALGRDLTLGSSPVYVRDQTATGAPESIKYGDIITDVRVIGEGGLVWKFTNPAASTAFGKRIRTLQLGGVTDQATAALYADQLLETGKDVSRSLTREYTVTDDTKFAPERDFRTGDWIKADTDAQLGERMRAFATSIREEGGELKAFVTLGTVHDDLLLKLAKRQNALTGGAGANSGPPPSGPDPDPSTDTMPPAQVTGLVGQSSAVMGPGGFPQAQVTLTWAAVTTNADGTPITDLDHYEILERPMGQAESLGKHVATTTDSSLNRSPYVVGSNWSFQVLAVDRNGLRGARSGSINVGMAQDTVPPQAPSTPIPGARLGLVTFGWDGNPATGTWPLDFDHIEVHTSTVSGFTPTDATRTDTLYGEGVSVVTSVAYGTAVYCRFVAVDKTPLKSAASAQATATPTQLVNTDLINSIVDARLLAPDSVGELAIADLAVGRTHIKDAAIGNAQLGLLAANDANIANVNVGKLVAGTMNAELLVANRITTALSGNRVQMEPTGIRMFRGSTLTVHLDPVPGQLRIYNTTDASHTSTGHGIQFGPNNGQNIIIDANEIMGRFNGTYGALALQREGGQVSLGGIPGGWPESTDPDTMTYGDVPPTDNHLITLRGTVYIPTGRRGDHADEWAPLMVGRRGDQHTWYGVHAIGGAIGDSATTFYIHPTYQDGRFHNASTVFASQTLQMRRLGVNNTCLAAWNSAEGSAGSAIQFYQEQVLARTEGIAGYVPLVASAFTPATSEPRLKKNRQAVDGLSVVKRAQAERFEYVDSIEPGDHKHVSPMVDDLPEDLWRYVDGNRSYDLVSLVGLLWEAVRQLAAEVERGPQR